MFEFISQVLEILNFPLMLYDKPACYEGARVSMPPYVDYDVNKAKLITCKNAADR